MRIVKVLLLLLLLAALTISRAPFRTSAHVRGYPESTLPVFGNAVSVMEFGAKGDGVTDDWGAIQNALNAVSSGGAVLFPPNRYRINSTLKIPITARKMLLVGYGATIDGYVDGAMLQISDLTTPNDRVEAITIEGLTLEGRGWTESITYPRQNGIELYSCLNICLRDVRIQNIPNTAIKGVKSPQKGSEYWNIVKLDHVAVRFVGFEGLAVGETGAAADDITIATCLFNNLGKRKTRATAEEGGVFINSSTVTISGSEFSNIRNEDNTSGYLNALVVRKASGLLAGNHFENNGNNQPGSSDVFLDKDANGLVILGQTHGALSTTAAQTGIRSRSAGVLIAGIQHDGNGAHALTNIVDVQGAADNIVLGVTDRSGSNPPKSNYVLINEAATGPTLVADKRYTRISRLRGPFQTDLVSGDFSLSGGWGSTAGISSVSAKDMRGRFTVASSGSGQAANPTITISFKDGAWTSAPYAIVSRNGGAQPSVLPVWTTSAAGLVITFPGTPVAGQTYNFEFIVIG